MIHLSGPEKCGTHALVKAVELLGIPIAWRDQPGALMSHMAHKDLMGEKHIFIKRHPKNAFISFCRYMNYEIQSGMLRSRLLNWQENGPYVQTWADKIGWLTDQHTLVIKYESLISDDGKTIKRIADYLEVPYLDDAFKNLPGKTATWTPVHSDYTTCPAWSDAVETAWSETGGDELVRVFGYDG